MYEDNVWLLGVNMETQGSCHIKYTMEKKSFMCGGINRSKSHFIYILKRPLTKGQPDLLWELQASVSAVWFQGHIFPELIKRGGGARSGILPTENEAGLKTIYKII